MSDEIKKELKEALEADAEWEVKSPAHIVDDFYEFHTLLAGRPLIVNVSTIMIIGVVDGATTLTFNVQEHNGPCVIEVREDYDAIKSILSRRYR